MKRASLLFVFLSSFPCFVFSQNGVGIGTATPHASALVDIQSNTKGMLIPRMTSAQRNAIGSAATGLLVFDNTTNSFWFKSASNWVELVDTMNNVWKRNGNSAYVGTTGNVGIGTSTPNYDLHISRSSPSIGFSDAGQNQFSGFITGSSSNLMINAYRKGLGADVAGNLLLQTSTVLPAPAYAGFVGIGTSSPEVKLQVEGGTDVTASAGGTLQLGGTNASNMAFDENEIQARNNGVVSKIFINPNGGGVQFGGTNNIIMTDDAKVYRNRPLSTNADLLPIAYAKMDGATANVLSGTGNLSLQRIDAGEYRLVLLGEANIYTDRNLYSILITPNYTISPRFGGAEIKSDNSIEVKIWRPNVNYTNSTCNSCTSYSYITNAAFWEEVDSPFTIMVYKR